MRARLLPCDHYLLTFTLPQELRPLARSHQKQVYDTLLRAAAAAVQAIAEDPAWVGGTVGILAVLHTWSRTLTYHPHAHLLVSAGALAADDSTWLNPPTPAFRARLCALASLSRQAACSAGRCRPRRRSP